MKVKRTSNNRKKISWLLDQELDIANLYSKYSCDNV